MTHSKNSGFSLIELAIALMVLGLLLIPFLHFQTIERKRQELEITSAHYNQAIARAIGQYFLTNNSYPCPAPLGLPISDPASGFQVCDKPATIPVDSCDFSAPINGICRVEGLADLDGDDVYNPMTAVNVLIGAVPFGDLKIAAQDSLDGWGNKFIYAVTEPLADDTIPFNYEGGAIRVWSFNPTTQTENINKGSAHIVVASMGRNEAGAYNSQGNLVNPCDLPVSRNENCDYDDRFHEDVDDDIVFVIDSAPIGIWAISPIDVNNIYNTNTGLIGIGTDNPKDDMNLDVEGDIKAEDAKADFFCDPDENCFRPAIISSINPITNRGYINCNDMPIEGIQSGEGICSGHSMTSMPGVCPLGEHVTGFDVSGLCICSGGGPCT